MYVVFACAWWQVIVCPSDVYLYADKLVHIWLSIHGNHSMYSISMYVSAYFVFCQPQCSHRHFNDPAQVGHRMHRRWTSCSLEVEWPGTCFFWHVRNESWKGPWRFSQNLACWGLHISESQWRNEHWQLSIWRGTCKFLEVAYAGVRWHIVAYGMTWVYVNLSRSLSYLPWQEGSKIVPDIMEKARSGVGTKWGECMSKWPKLDSVWPTDPPSQLRILRRKKKAFWAESVGRCYMVFEKQSQLFFSHCRNQISWSACESTQDFSTL